MSVRATPVRWLVIYAIVATAFAVGLVVQSQDVKRDNAERDRAVETECAIATATVDAIHALVEIYAQPVTVPPGLTPAGEALVATLNSRAERVQVVEARLDDRLDNLDCKA